MGKILSERLAGPDDPIYSEPGRGYSPHSGRAIRLTISRTKTELFRRCRRALDLSQAEIAGMLRVASDRTIRRWEAGTMLITGEAWVTLRDLLAVRGLPLAEVEAIMTRSCDTRSA